MQLPTSDTPASSTSLIERFIPDVTTDAAREVDGDDVADLGLRGAGLADLMEMGVGSDARLAEVADLAGRIRSWPAIYRLAVVDAIERVATGRRGMHDDVPLEDVVIQRAVEVA